MPKTKVAVTLSAEILRDLDALIAEKLERLSHTRLAREAAKLDPLEEKALAEEGMGIELASWPEY